ncbi:Esterase/lipase/thioesterase family active site [Mycena venus]|uniref:Esterase/lipase/thioesterase family active site n=1 Tax=Mycena venus TaxID=2733690 RepID=A0A8H6TW83_9AGAR|nr:Esterase/lipase/thioesterase family active site [Mycena venus]
MYLALIYGWGGDESTWELLAWRLRNLGHNVFVPRIPGRGTINERSAVLVEQLRSWAKRNPIHLIGHSMGGLNARDIAASTATNGLYILSVTTLGTPHYGSHKATFANLLSLGLIHHIRYINLTLNTFIAHMASEFNAATPNNDNVLYLSWAGRYDEWVSVSSATWGHYLGSRDMTHSQLPGSDMVERTLPILQDWTDNRDWSSYMPKIRAVQASGGGVDVIDLLQGCISVKEAVINVADNVTDTVLSFVPGSSWFWR